MKCFRALCALDVLNLPVTRIACAHYFFGIVHRCFCSSSVDHGNVLTEICKKTLAPCSRGSVKCKWAQFKTATKWNLSSGSPYEHHVKDGSF